MMYTTVTHRCCSPFTNAYQTHLTKSIYGPQASCLVNILVYRTLTGGLGTGKISALVNSSAMLRSESIIIIVIIVHLMDRHAKHLCESSTTVTTLAHLYSCNWNSKHITYLLKITVIGNLGALHSYIISELVGRGAVFGFLSCH